MPTAGEPEASAVATSNGLVGFDIGGEPEASMATEVKGDDIAQEKVKQLFLLPLNLFH
jgi:hypothetical protein